MTKENTLEERVRFLKNISKDTTISDEIFSFLGTDRNRISKMGYHSSIPISLGVRTYYLLEHEILKGNKDIFSPTLKEEEDEYLLVSIIFQGYQNNEIVNVKKVFEDRLKKYPPFCTNVNHLDFNDLLHIFSESLGILRTTMASMIGIKKFGESRTTKNVLFLISGNPAFKVPEGEELSLLNDIAKFELGITKNVYAYVKEILEKKPVVLTTPKKLEVEQQTPIVTTSKSDQKQEELSLALEFVQNLKEIGFDMAQLPTLPYLMYVTGMVSERIRGKPDLRFGVLSRNFQEVKNKVKLTPLEIQETKLMINEVVKRLQIVSQQNPAERREIVSTLDHPMSNLHITMAALACSDPFAAGEEMSNMKVWAKKVKDL